MDVRNARIRTLSWAVALAVGGFGLTRASLELVNAHTGAATIWPLAGLGLAALVIAPRSRWPAFAVAILAGCVGAQLLVRGSLAAALAIGVCAALQAVAGAWVVTRLARGPRPQIGSMETVGALIVAGVGVTALFALPGTAVLHLAGSATSSFASAWLAWWMANAVGVLVVTPAVLALLDPGPDRAGPWETAGLVALTGFAAMLLFWHEPGHGPVLLRYAYPILPLLLWCAVRIGARATTFASAGVAMIAAVATTRGLGPFALPSLEAHQRVQVLQGYLAMVVLSTLLVGAVVADQRRARALARRDADRLTSLLNASSEVSIIGADLDGAITVFSPGAEMLTGRTAQEMLGQTTCRLHDPDELDARAAELGVATRTEALTHAVRHGASERRDWTYVHVDGSRRRVSLTTTGQHDAAGNLSGFLAIATDITQREAQMRALRRAQTDLRTVFDQAPIGHAIVVGGTLLEGNAALEAITGYETELLRELGPAAIVHPDDRPALRALVATIGAGTTRAGEREIRIRHRAGHELDVALHVAALSSSGQEHGRILVQVVDVTHRTRLEEQLRALADRDPMSGLLNRRRFGEELDAHLERCRRYGAEGALVVLDVDAFKHVNDTRGHHAGDALIMGVSGLLRERLRSSDVVARLGGDEFAVLLPRATREEATLVAQALVDGVRDALGVTISLGVAMVGDGGHRSADGLMIAADRAMYEAKAAGRDGHAFFMPA
jgi:diguanylate cyclase (GGDEF)-like protein/PAS domain S-box-containing protein